MAAFTDLSDLLRTSVRWEKKLQDFYEVAEFGLKSEESKRAVTLLKENQEERLRILENVKIKDFGQSEWVMFARSYRDDDILPTQTVTRESTPDDVINAIKGYETKLRDFYADVRDHLVGRGQKELFASLVVFKDNQIEEIDRLIS